MDVPLHIVLIAIGSQAVGAVIFYLLYRLWYFLTD